MLKIVIFGNSGSGKSTLASRYARGRGVRALDLDTLAWKENAVREEVEESLRKLRSFIATNSQWVIEGCYGSLLGEAVRQANEIIFMNPGTAVCLNNCKSRPWEPHKYQTPEEQANNLEMLLRWVADYERREDEFSYAEHRRIFDGFPGKKWEIRSNAEAEKWTVDCEP